MLCLLVLGWKMMGCKYSSHSRLHPQWVCHSGPQMGPLGLVLSTSLRLSLIAGLDCGLDHWTGLLDWITGLIFELKLCVPHYLHR